MHPDRDSRGQCTFGPRLAEDDMKLLAAFFKSEDENGWPKIDGSETDQTTKQEKANLVFPP